DRTQYVGHVTTQLERGQYDAVTAKMDLGLQTGLAGYLAGRCAGRNQRAKTRCNNLGQAGGGLCEPGLAIDRRDPPGAVGPDFRAARADPIKWTCRRIRYRLGSFAAQAEHRRLPLLALDALRKSHEHAGGLLRAAIAGDFVRIVEPCHQWSQRLYDPAVGSRFRQGLAEINGRQSRKRIGRNLAVDLVLERAFDVGDLYGRTSLVDDAAGREMQLS